MQADLPLEAHHLATLVQHSLGSLFSANTLIAYVSRTRNKAVIIEEQLIHTAYLGLCFSFTNCDLIIIVPGLSRRLYLITLLHELIHILRGEAKEYARPYDKQLHDAVVNVAMTRRDADTMYEDLPESVRDIEDIAEGTATLLFDAVWKHQESIPTIVQRIYGYKEE